MCACLPLRREPELVDQQNDQETQILCPRPSMVPEPEIPCDRLQRFQVPYFLRVHRWGRLKVSRKLAPRSFVLELVRTEIAVPIKTHSYHIAMMTSSRQFLEVNLVSLASASWNSTKRRPGYRVWRGHHQAPGSPLPVTGLLCPSFT